MKWISVKDRLPKHNQLVKFRSNDLWLAEGIFQDGKFIYSWIKGACFGEITDWTPLPEPSKEEK
jgi:hypothetical protein